MPREQRTRIDAVPQRKVTKAREQREVVAAPRNTTVTPDTQTSLSQLARGLSAVNPEIQQVLDTEHTAQVNEGRTRGAAAANTMGLEESAKLLKEGAILPDESPYFMQGFKEQRGIMLALDRKQKMSEEYDNGKYDWQTGNFDAFALEHAKQDEEHLSDPLAMRGYTSVMQKFIPELRQKAAQAKAQGQIEEAERGLVARTKDSLTSYAQHGDLNRLHAEVESIRHDGRKVFGTRNPRLDEILFNTVYSHDLEQPNPQVFDLFSLSHPDGQKGMAFSPKWEDNIAKARQASGARLRAATSRDSEQTKYEIRRWFHDQSEAGNEISPDSVTHFLKDSGHPKGVLDASTLDSLVQENNKEAKLARVRRAVGAAVNAGRTDVLSELATREGGVYKPQIQRGFDEEAARILSTDPEHGFARVAQLGALNGLTHSPLKESFALANPENKKAFTEAALRYNSLKVQNPAYALQHVSEDRAIQFDLFNGAIASGATPEQAVEGVRRSGSPERQREIKAMLRGEWARKWAKEVDNALDVDADMNQAYVRSTVFDLASHRLAHGDVSVEKAVEWGQQVFKSRHDLINGNYVPNFGSPRSDYVKLAMEWYLKEEAAQQVAAGNSQAKEGLYIEADTNTSKTGNYHIGYKSNGNWLTKRPLSAIVKAFGDSKSEFSAEYHQLLQDAGVDDEANPN